MDLIVFSLFPVVVMAMAGLFHVEMARADRSALDAALREPLTLIAVEVDSAPSAAEPDSVRGDDIALDETMTAEQHAALLLAWMQTDSRGPCGVYLVYAADLIDAYREMCMEMALKAHMWRYVGAHFADLTPTNGNRKYYATIEGRRVRAYTIPACPAVEVSLPLAA